jgi:hypothetical protein
MKKIIIAALTIVATAAVATLAYNHFNAEESTDSSVSDDPGAPEETTTDADAPAADAEIHASDMM